MAHVHARVSYGRDELWYYAVGDSARGPFATREDAIASAKAEGFEVVAEAEPAGERIGVVPLPTATVSDPYLDPAA